MPKERSTLKVKQEVFLSPYKGKEEKIFTNRDKGIKARESLELDRLENEDGRIEVLLPEDVWGINPSFFGGMFETSIIKLRQGFWDKYVFLYENRKNLDETLKDCIEYDYEYILKHMEI